MWRRAVNRRIRVLERFNREMSRGKFIEGRVEMLVSRKNFGDDWTVVRGPKREHKVKSAGVRILGENQEGMSVKLYVKYLPRPEEDAHLSQFNLFPRTLVK